VRRNLWEHILNRPGAQPLTDGREAGKSIAREVISYFRDDTDQIEDNLAGVSEIAGSGCLPWVDRHPPQRQRADNAVCLPAPDGHGGHCPESRNRIKQYRRAGRQATQQVTGARRRDVCSASDSGGRAETTVLNQLRQVNERRRQMMVQDKLLTAILNSMFQNMVSIGTSLILLLTSQSMQAGVGTLTVGTSPCLSTCRL